ncbi:MAG: hypothetical protein ACFFEF_06355 [Candidatus Thorarchaeota archaeon]
MTYSSEYSVDEYQFSRNAFSWRHFASIRAGYYINVQGVQIPISVSLEYFNGYI